MSNILYKYTIGFKSGAKIVVGATSIEALIAHFIERVNTGNPAATNQWHIYKGKLINLSEIEYIE